MADPVGVALAAEAEAAADAAGAAEAGAAVAAVAGGMAGAVAPLQLFAGAMLATAAVGVEMWAALAVPGPAEVVAAAAQLVRVAAGAAAAAAASAAAPAAVPAPCSSGTAARRTWRPACRKADPIGDDHTKAAARRGASAALRPPAPRQKT